jgi:hypothetical protein
MHSLKESTVALVRAVVSRRLGARLLSTFLCTVLVLIRPISLKYGGPSAFLALTIQTLAFFAQDTLAAQIEVTLLNLVFGALLGIGWSLLATVLASRCSAYGPGARTILAVFLVTAAFLTGWMKSRLPRLTLSARICAFICIWMLTTGSEYSHVCQPRILRSGLIHCYPGKRWASRSSTILVYYNSIVILRSDCQYYLPTMDVTPVPTADGGFIRWAPCSLPTESPAHIFFDKCNSWCPE